MEIAQGGVWGLYMGSRGSAKKQEQPLLWYVSFAVAEDTYRPSPRFIYSGDALDARMTKKPEEADRSEFKARQSHSTLAHSPIHARPCLFHSRPIPTYGRPITIHGRPITIHGRPITSARQAEITTHKKKKSRARPITPPI